jgi:hypothetical protein
MSVATHDEESWPTPASMVRALLRAVTTAIEAHARYSAISPSRFQQADREIRRCRRLMRAAR